MLKLATSSWPGGDLLNALFVLEGALFVMVGQAPARFDAEKRSAIGPQR